jgi:hypothetical protein
VIVRLVLFVLGSSALYLAVRTLRTASQGRITWVSTVRWGERPGLFCLYVSLSFFLLLAGTFAVSRAITGLT